MNDLKLECSLKESISSKSGKPYKYLEIKLTPTYSKKVFLEDSELEILNMLFGKVK